MKLPSRAIDRGCAIIDKKDRESRSYNSGLISTGLVLFPVNIDMPVYSSNGTQQQCGYAAGVLCMDEYLPFPPGTVSNASTYEYPVLYKLVPGWRSGDVVAGTEENFLPALLEKARELEQAGVRFISCNCGFALRLQEQVAAAVNIPVAMSPLLQLPMIAASLGAGQSIGVIGAVAPPLSPEFIEDCGVRVKNELIVRGLQDEPGFAELLAACGVGAEKDDSLVEYDTDDICADVVRVATKMRRENPTMGAILFECSEFPLYAKAAQDATGLPVFDFVTLIDYMHRATLPPEPRGFM